MRCSNLLHVLVFGALGNTLAIASTSTDVIESALQPYHGTDSSNEDLNHLDRRDILRSLFFEHPNGASVVLDVTWINKRQFGVQYNLKDTKGDSHGVYSQALVSDKQELGGVVYRCNNNNGHGNSIICPTKVFEVSGSNTVIGVSVRLCIDIQRGGDDCRDSTALINPFK
jgi:hypothetical protein